MPQASKIHEQPAKKTGRRGSKGAAADEALRRSEQKFANIFLNSLDVLLIIDVDTGNVITANHALEAVLGYEIEELEGKHFSVLHPPDPDSSIQEIEDTGHVHGAVFQAQRIVKADGSIIPMDLTATPIPWEDGTALLATLRDASDRENALQALRESEQRYRALFDQASDAIILENESAQILDANRAASRMTGRGETDLRAMLVTDLQPERIPTLPETGAASPGIGLPYETFVKRADESQCPVEVTVAALKTGGKNLFLSIIRDITERKRVEEALRQGRIDLERRVRERTAELKELNERLLSEIAERKRAEKRIKNSLAEKEVLLQEIHHRVKNNLQIISSLLTLQGRKIRDAKVAAALNDSQNRIRSMALIHEQLYHSEDLARIDFAAYLRNLCNTVLRSYSDEGAAVSMKIEADPVWMGVGQAIPCGLILNELVSNCIKHAFPKGAGGLVRAGLTRGEGGLLTLFVADNGKGLPPDLEYRKSNSLGLRLITNLAEAQLRGRMEVRSDNGTEVRITFQDEGA